MFVYKQPKEALAFACHWSHTTGVSFIKAQLVWHNNTTLSLVPVSLGTADLQDGVQGSAPSQSRVPGSAV